MRKSKSGAQFDLTPLKVLLIYQGAAARPYVEYARSILIQVGCKVLVPFGNAHSLEFDPITAINSLISDCDAAVALVTEDLRPASSAGNLWFEVGLWRASKPAVGLLLCAHRGATVMVPSSSVGSGPVVEFDREIDLEQPIKRHIENMRSWLASNRKPAAFVSYVREDQAAVDRLVFQLRARSVSVWLDRESIEPGRRWKAAIRSAIRRGTFFLACFSENYVRRDSTYMNEELTVAIEDIRRRSTDRIWFIPVLLSPCDIPDREIGAGEYLADLQWVNLAENWSDGVNRLAQLMTISPET